MKNQELDSGNGNTARLSKKLLKEIRLNDNLNTLEVLIETLELTVDPDPSELYLLESLHHLREKILMTESRINSFLIKSKAKIPENKLEDLYNNEEGIGTSKLFR